MATKYDELRRRLSMRGILMTNEQLVRLDKQNHKVVSIFHDLIVSIGKTTIRIDALGDEITRAEWDKIQISNRIVGDTALTTFCRWLDDHPIPK